MKAVCATDLSAASAAAIQNEACLRCLRSIGVEEIHLVSVLPSNVHVGMPGIDFGHRRRRSLGQYRSAIETAGFRVETHVVRGTPHRRIRGLAETIGADLTIVGSRGSSPLENRLIGSTARNLARTTDTPLLVNRIERETAQPRVIRENLFKHMLFATDFSPNAERAFSAFSYLLEATESIVLVHIKTPKDPRYPAAKTRLDEMAEQLASWDITVSTEIGDGDPAAEILKAERAHSPDTILVGTRGHSRLRRLLLGSVSESIVAHAAGNVLLVPPRDHP